MKNIWTYEDTVWYSCFFHGGLPRGKRLHMLKNHEEYGLENDPQMVGFSTSNC